MSSFLASERRLGLPRANDLSRFQTATRPHETDDEEDGYYDSEEEEQERLLSRQHGEAEESKEDGADNKKKRKQQTDEEIAAEYKNAKKVKSNKARRKVIEETDLTKPDGLSSIFINFPLKFHNPKREYKKTRQDMAQFSTRLLSAYQDWANNIVPGTPLEEVLWKLHTLNSKTSVKRFLQHMRHQVRDHKVERIYGLEKAQELISQLDEEQDQGYALQEPAAREAQEAEGAVNNEQEVATREASPSNSLVPANATAQADEAPDMRDMMTVHHEEEKEEDYHDMIPMEEEDYPDYDMYDMEPVVPKLPATAVPPVADSAASRKSPPADTAANTATNTVASTTSLAKNAQRRVLDDDESSDEEELVFETSSAATSKPSTPANARRAIVDEEEEDSDEEDAAENDEKEDMNQANEPTDVIAAKNIPNHDAGDESVSENDATVSDKNDKSEATHGVSLNETFIKRTHVFDNQENLSEVEAKEPDTSVLANAINAVVETPEKEERAFDTKPVEESKDDDSSSSDEEEFK